QRRDVVGVLAFLEVLVLRVRGVERRLDLRRRLGARDRRQHQHRQRGHGRRAVRRACSHHLPPNESLKLYLAENWIRKSSEVKPSRKFSRLPHCTSGPRKTLGSGE